MMLILKPISVEKIWGTPRLQKYGGSTSIEKIGAVYSATGIPELSNEIINSPYEETNLFEAVINHHSDFGLPKDTEFPVIVAFTGADENLSIQVHPTDEFASENENKKIGKSESWYFIDQPLDGWIYSGSKESNKDQILEAMNVGNFEAIIDTLDVKQNDLVFIPSGTLHALTKGSLVYEIQQSTDITYRFFDYNRKDKDGKQRELHLDKALKTLKTENNSKKEIFLENTLFDEKPYTLQKMKLSNIYKNETKIAQVITVTKGELVVENQAIKQGYSFIVFPKEMVHISEEAECVIATPHVYWE
jgi:mannose-6-phosphate isomerase